MRAAARLRVEAPCRIVDCQAEAPFALRSDGCGTIWLVGAAAGPVGGDDLALCIEVGPGACVAVRSVAAQLALPDPAGQQSTVRIAATVAPGAHLDWAPEPTIVATGADLVQRSEVDVADGGSLRWRESLVLGRHGEEPGAVAARLHIDLAGRPLLRHELLVGDDRAAGWDGPAGLAGARTITTEVLAGGGAGTHPLRDRTVTGDGIVVLPLEGDGVLAVRATAGRHARARAPLL